jgi:Carboxypeptidase regulatory-like domain/TonB-dependent Receptor Plug Domain
MCSFPRRFVFVFWPFLLSSLAISLHAQSATGTITGTVADTSGAVVPGATVTIENPVSGLARTTKTDGAGHYQFTNLPFNPYHLAVNAPGFSSFSMDVPVRSTVPVTPTIALRVGGASTTVTVTADDLVENDSSLHTDLDRNLIEKLPLESSSSSVSSLVTLSSPGVSADSNGLFHGLGDHASNSFSVDGQPITDQQSKVFSNQIPSNSIQSIEVIAGAPPAEFGGKTSLVIQVTTRSGQGLTKPTGSVTTSYGTFGTASGGFDIGYGSATWGNFFELDGLDTGRFLDPPEFKVFHDKGNQQNVFDRADYQVTPTDSFHLNLNYSRSWFQTPNTYDNLNVLDQFGNDVGNADQHSKIETFDIAPTYTRTIRKNSVFNFGPYIRKDVYQYFPSENPLADLGPPNLQSQTIGQYRTLTNAGVHSDISYTQGNQTIKAGVIYSNTFLRERDSLGIVAPTFNSPCLDGSGRPVNGFTSPAQCAAFGLEPNTAGFDPVLLPYDLTRGGTNYSYFGHADIKELALYVEDSIKAGNWVVNVGIRGDMYNGLASATQAEPRVGLSYNVKRTGTVLRVSYARTLESPFNENLVLSSQGCSNAVLSPLLHCTSGVAGTLQPGFRNEIHAGLQQAFGKNVVFSGDYIWKYTHNAFDFSVLGNTPITFPIDWHNSKVPGLALRVDVPNYHNLSAFVVMSSVAARFFPPQVAGAGATVGGTGLPFRIDHDERFNQTTHVQYQLPFRRSPWIGFNWRFDSGMVAGSAPCYNPLSNDPNSACGPTSTLLNGQPAVDLSSLTADQEFEAGLTCGNIKASLTTPLPTPCPASEYGSTLLSIPAPGTGDNDHNPPRIAQRNLFDASIGDDNLFDGDRYKWSLHVTGVNMSNKYALYNFLSTFSGTHYVTPRTLSAELGFHF